MKQTLNPCCPWLWDSMRFTLNPVESKPISKPRRVEIHITTERDTVSLGHHDDGINLDCKSYLRTLSEAPKRRLSDLSEQKSGLGC